MQPGHRVNETVDAVASFFSEVRAAAGAAGAAFDAAPAGTVKLGIDRDAAAGLAAAIEALAAGEAIASEPRVRLFHAVMRQLLDEGTVDLSKRLGEACGMGMSNSAVRSVLAEINQAYVIPAGLEITSHGLLRSFRFWSWDEKTAYLRHTAELVALLRDEFGHACLAYGAVLSYERSGDLSPHDDDLDVLVGLDMQAAPTFGAGVERVSAFLSEASYEVVGRWPAFIKVRRPQMRSDIDVFVGLNERGHLASIPGPRGVIPWETLFPAREGELYGVTLAVPAQAERYLELVYGASWRTPQPGWQHRWDYPRYADIT